MSESVPIIVIPIEQAVEIETQSARGEVIEAGFVVEMTSFDCKENRYVLEGALLCSGYAQSRSTYEQNDTLELDNIDGDVFSMDTGMEAGFAGYAPASARIPFRFETPVSAQDPGLLNVIVRVERGTSLVFDDNNHAVLSGNLVIEGMRGDDGYRLTMADQSYEMPSSREVPADGDEAQDVFTTENASTNANSTTGAYEDVVQWREQLQGADRAFDGELRLDEPLNRPSDFHFEDYASALGSPTVGPHQAPDPVSLESYASTFFSEQEDSQQRSPDANEEASLSNFTHQSEPPMDWMSPFPVQSVKPTDDSMWELPELDNGYTSEETLNAEQSTVKISFHSQPSSEQPIQLKSLLTPHDDDGAESLAGGPAFFSNETTSEDFTSDTIRLDQGEAEVSAIASIDREEIVEPSAPIELDHSVESTERELYNPPLVETQFEPMADSIAPTNDSESPIAIPIPLAPVPDVPVLKLSDANMYDATTHESTPVDDNVAVGSGNNIAKFLDTIYTDTGETKFTMKFRIVQPGETIEQIAEKYRLLSGDLMEANHLTTEVLDVGGILYIPPRQPIKIQ